jgi:hypothetical protein
MAFYFWPRPDQPLHVDVSMPLRADLNVYSAPFRTHLMDSIVGDRALMVEATEDLNRRCLEEPFVAWVKPFTHAEIRERDDVGVRFIIRNAGAAPATGLRISVDPWHDLPRATVTTSANIQPALISSVTSRDHTLDVITVPRIPPRTTAVVTYSVSLPPGKRSNSARSFEFPLRVLSADDATSIKAFEVSVAWADSAESAVTRHPVTYPISMSTPVSYEDLHGDTARALVHLKVPYCTPKSTTGPTSVR